MIQITPLLILIIVLSACVGGGGGGLNKTEINAVVDKALTGFSATHEQTLRSTMTPDVILEERLGTETYSTSGIDDVVSVLLAFRRTIQTIHHIDIHDRSVTGSGNQAVLTGTFFLDATYYTFTGGSRETTIEAWRIELTRSSGHWLIQRIERTL